MNQEKKQPGTLRHRIFTIIGIILCVILIPIVIINCTLIIKNLTNKDDVPSIGGIFPMIVTTDSMKGTFDGGSLIICRTADPEDIEVGDIICFYDPLGNGTTTVTHRVTEVNEDKDGNITWTTKGDNNNTEDDTPVPEDKLVGVYQFHIDKLGSLAMFMQSTPGLIIFIALPVLILVGYDVIRRRLYEKRRDSDTDALVAELEQLRASSGAQPQPQQAFGAAPGQQSQQPLTDTSMPQPQPQQSARTAEQPSQRRAATTPQQPLTDTSMPQPQPQQPAGTTQPQPRLAQAPGQPQPQQAFGEAPGQPQQETGKPSRSTSDILSELEQLRTSQQPSQRRAATTPQQAAAPPTRRDTSAPASPQRQPQASGRPSQPQQPAGTTQPQPRLAQAPGQPQQRDPGYAPTPHQRQAVDTRPPQPQQAARTAQQPPRPPHPQDEHGRR